MKYFKTSSEINVQECENLTYIKSGITNIDNCINGFAIGELSVWSGGNGSGKSTILNQIAIESILDGHNVLIFSGELKDSRLMKWLDLQLCGKENLKFIKETSSYFPKDIDTTIQITNNKLFIYDNEIGNNIETIMNAIIEAKEKKNVEMVILDNLMSMNLSTYGSDKYDIQTKFVTDLTALAKKLNIHIHFVCHPRKSTNFLRKYDISGTADLTNLADNVFIVHRVNNDFKNQIKDTFKWKNDNMYYKEICKFDNIIEICKNREQGVQDTFIGQYFEIDTKRFLNSKNEEKKYYEKGLKLLDIENQIKDLPI